MEVRTSRSHTAPMAAHHHREKHGLLALVLFICLQAILYVAQLEAMRWLFSGVLDRISVSEITRTVGMVVGVFMTYSVLSTWVQRLRSRYEERLVMRNQQRVIDAVVMAQAQDRSRMHVQDMLTRINQDSDTAIRGHIGFRLSLWHSGVQFFAYLAYLTWLSPLMAIGVVGFGVFVQGLIAISQGRLTPWFTRQAQRFDHMIAILADTTESIGLIRCMNATGYSWRTFRTRSAAFLEAINDSVRRQFSVQLMYNIASTGMMISIYLLGAWLVTTGRLGLGAIVPCIMVSFELLSPLGTLAEVVKTRQTAKVSAGRVDELLTVLNSDQQTNTITDSGVSQRPQASALGVHVAMDDVVCRGDADKEIIRIPQLEIAPGSFTTIVGPTGAGKSTLLRAIVGLQVYSGSVTLDGHDVRSLTLETIGQSVAYVAQSPYLFSGTVLENICLGMDRPTGEAQLRRLLPAQGIVLLDGLQTELADGLHTAVGVEGSKISVGQRQRVAMLRAVARRSRLLCVDEPSSALDAVSELQVRELLSALHRGGTTIVAVSHRAAFLTGATDVVMVGKGYIAGHGPIASLSNDLERFIAGNLKEAT